MSGSNDSSVLAKAISNSVNASFTKIEKVLSAYLDSSKSLSASVSNELLDCADSLFSSSSSILFSANTLLVSARHLVTTSGILAASANDIMSVSQGLGDLGAIRGKASANTKKTKTDDAASGSWFDAAKNAYKETKSFLDTARGVYKEAKGIKDAWQGKGKHKGDKPRGQRLLDWLLDRESPSGSQGISVGELAAKESGVQKVFVVNWPDNLGGNLNFEIDLDLARRKKGRARKGSKTRGSAYKGKSTNRKQNKPRSIPSHQKDKGTPLSKNKAKNYSSFNRSQNKPSIIDRAKSTATSSVPAKKTASNKGAKHAGSIGGAAKRTSNIPSVTNKTSNAGKVAKGPVVSAAAKGGGNGFLSGHWKKARGVVGKVGGGTLLKSFAKKIPGVSLLMGGIGAAQRAMKGDWLGALGEVASGVAGMVPGIGTAVSTVIDGGLVAHDMINDGTPKSPQAAQKTAKKTSVPTNPAGSIKPVGHLAQTGPASARAFNMIRSASKAAKGTVARTAAKDGGGLLSGLWQGLKSKAAGITSKAGGGTILKSLAKKVPGVSLVMGGIGAVQRATQGDWLGALGETASGVAGMVPGVGTAISTIIDGTLISRDLMAEKEKQASSGAKTRGRDITYQNEASQESSRIESKVRNPETTPNQYYSNTPGANSLAGGLQVSINQVVNLAAGATAEGLEATLTQGRDRLRQEVETIVRDMFHRQRRVSFGSVNA